MLCLFQRAVGIQTSAPAYCFLVFPITTKCKPSPAFCVLQGSSAVLEGPASAAVLKVSASYPVVMQHTEAPLHESLHDWVGVSPHQGRAWCMPACMQQGLACEAPDGTEV